MILRCLRCGKKIPEREARKIEEAGVEPFCSQYCGEIYGGVPLPFTQADWVRLKWEEINRQREMEKFGLD